MSLLREYIRDLLIESEAMTQDKVQSIVDRVFPQIMDDRGPGRQGVPRVELHADIYARHSGIEGMEGELSHSSKAEFVDEDNAIYVYYPNMTNEEDVIRSLLHEFEHAHQDPKKYEEKRAEGYDGLDNPYEVDARNAESRWKDYLVDPAEKEPVPLREYVRSLLTEKELRGQKDKRVMYHIGKRPASPKPAERWGEKGGWTRSWMDGPVPSGVFLTPNPVDVVQHHGVSGNVYTYKVPEWVIDKAGGKHRFDSAGELLVSQEIWEEAGDEIEFLGKKMGQKELWDSIKSSWFGDRRYSNRKKKPGEVSISSLAQTKHPEQAIKMMTAQEREKAWEQFQEKYPGSLKGEPFEIEWEKVPGERKGQPKSWRIGEPRISKYDKKLIDLLQKHMKESVLREYVRDLLIEQADWESDETLPPEFRSLPPQMKKQIPLEIRKNFVRGHAVFEPGQEITTTSDWDGLGSDGMPIRVPENSQLVTQERLHDGAYSFTFKNPTPVKVGMKFEEDTIAEPGDEAIIKGYQLWEIVTESVVREHIRSLLLEDAARRDQLGQDLYDSGWREGELIPDPVGPEMEKITRQKISAGRDLKKAFAKNADRAFLDSLVTVHWMRNKSQLENFIQGKATSRDELSTSAYLPGQIKGAGAFGGYGALVKGHITLLANDMDQLFTGHGSTYTYIDPQRTKMSGANKGIQQKYEPGDYAQNKIIVLDKEDWDPSGGARTNNEALVDNWTPMAIIVPDSSSTAGVWDEDLQKTEPAGPDRAEAEIVWEPLLKKWGLDIPVMSHKEFTSRGWN